MQDTLETIPPQQGINKSKIAQHVVIANLTLHTEIAHDIFYATWKKGNIGLVQFASQVAKIYKASQADDPYADWYLMKVYDAIFTAKERLQKIEEKTASYFDNQRGLKLQYTPNKPWQHELRIINPFSYMGAGLLTDLDHILRQIIIVRHVCAQTESELTIKQPIKELQNSFAVPFVWKDTKVTRTDIRSANHKALEAKEAFKESLPNDVLNEKIEFSYLPKKKTK
ncbi:MAG: AcaB family transcriptional regulator [Gammaproteobacteria bacterium]